MNLIEIPRQPTKEVFTIKSDGKYYGVITGDECVFVISESFDSPLKASNHARSLKRQHKISVNIKKQENKSVAKNTPKIIKKNKLYTESEMASHTHLRFREAWVIIGPKGGFATNILANDTVVKYVEDSEQAQTFKTYEEAIISANVLDRVLKKGHSLRRFFQEADKDT